MYDLVHVVGWHGSLPSDIAIVESDDFEGQKLIDLSELIGDRLIRTVNINDKLLIAKDQLIRMPTPRADKVEAIERRIYHGNAPSLGITDVTDKLELEDDHLFNLLWNRASDHVDGGSQSDQWDIAKRVASAYAVLAFGTDILLTV